MSQKKHPPMNACVCPNCGNTSDTDHGITLAWLEWMTVPVVGHDHGKVICDYSMYESADIGKDDQASVKNVPNVEPDLTHCRCNKCGWNWFPHEGHDDVCTVKTTSDPEPALLD